MRGKVVIHLTYRGRGVGRMIIKKAINATGQLVGVALLGLLLITAYYYCAVCYILGGEVI